MTRQRRMPVARCLGPAFLVLALALATGCTPPNSMLRRQATDAILANEIDYADNRMTLALKQEPTDGKSQYYMGLIRLRQDRPLDAQLHLERALTLRHGQEDVPQILDALAEALFQQKAYESLTAFLQTAATDSGDSYGFLRQAQYLMRINDVDGARVAFRKAVRLADPEDEKPYLAMAELFEQVGDKENTILALRHAYAIKPNSPSIAASLRKQGVIPGPAAGLEPQNITKPELQRR